MAYIVYDPDIEGGGIAFWKKERKNGPWVWLAGLAVSFLLCLENSFAEVMMPIISFAESDDGGKGYSVQRQIGGIWSLYAFLTERDHKTSQMISMDEILLAEAQESLEEAVTDVSYWNDETESLQDLLKAENDAAMALVGENSVFQPHQLQNKVDLSALSDYEELVKNFYTIDKNTMVGSDQLDAAKLLGKDLSITKEGEGPQILIYHTHSQEAFADSVPGDASTSIVGVGERLKEILETQYGYRVMHHMGQYDVEVRDDAYSKSLPAIEKILQENPSIQVVIDLHRDEMAKETRLVMDLDGRPTARFMFFNGLSRTKKTGNISYLYNENLADNLAFSFQMQMKATEYYPGIVRKIYLKGYRYNMHLKPRTLLIELGAQNNTVEEAMNATDPIAHILDMVLSGESDGE